MMNKGRLGGNCKTSNFAGYAGVSPAFFKKTRTRRPRTQGFCNFRLVRALKYILARVIVPACALAYTGCLAGNTSSSHISPNMEENPSIEADDNDALVGFPIYPGARKLPDPVKFEWKNLNSAYAVPDSQWAYYDMPAPYSEVAAFYRFESSNPPFRSLEFYWKETDNGILSAFFQEHAENKYSRIWFIPNPGNIDGSHLIIMRNNDVGGCTIF